MPWGIDRGFEVVLIYIGTESVEINLARIANRVLGGGRWTFGGAISVVFRICPPPLESLIEFYYSTTPMIWVTSPSA